MITDDAAIALAFIFGVSYNVLIEWLHKRNGGDRGFIAFEVIIGVLGVLAITSFINANKHYSFGSYVLTNGQSAAWIALRCFVGAGIPMFFGSINRALQKMD